MKRAPIVFLAYRRPEHTKKVLESLANNKEAKESELYVFIDGPKGSEDIEKVEEVKSIVRERSWCGKISIHESKENRGCFRQLIDAVTWACKEKGRVIVVEDDNLLAPYFLDYMNTALDLYANAQKVMEVSGYMFPIKDLTLETGFIRGAVAWGWGTWERAWSAFEPDGSKLLAKLSDKRLQYEFNFRNSYDFYSMLKAQVEGKIGGWDIRWHVSIFLRGGLTLVPGTSLTMNIGFDGTGTNTHKTGIYTTQLFTKPICKFPTVIEESDEMLDATIRYFKAIKNSTPFLTRLITGLKGIR